MPRVVEVHSGHFLCADARAVASCSSRPRVNPLDIREVATRLRDGHLVSDLGRHKIVGGACRARLRDRHGVAASDGSIGRCGVNDEPNGAERGWLLRDDVARVPSGCDSAKDGVGGYKRSVSVNAASCAA